MSECKEKDDWMMRDPIDLHVDNMTVLVGEEKSAFYIHRDILYARSIKYFAKASADTALDGGQPNTIELPDLNPVAFAIFATWLLTGEIRTSFVPGENEEEREEAAYKAAEWANIILLVEAYIMGDDMEVLAFKSAVITALATRLGDSGYLPDESLVDWIYSNTKRDSPLRRLIVDTLAVEGPTTLGSLRNVKHFDFFYELVLAIKMNGMFEDLGVAMDTLRDTAEALMGAKVVVHRKLTPFEKNPCVYHDHFGRHEEVYEDLDSWDEELEDDNEASERISETLVSDNTEDEKEEMEDDNDTSERDPETPVSDSSEDGKEEGVGNGDFVGERKEEEVVAGKQGLKRTGAEAFEESGLN